MQAVMAATISGPTWVWYGTSASLVNRMASIPPSMRRRVSSRARSMTCCIPPVVSYSGVPGSGRRWTHPMIGLLTPQISSNTGSCVPLLPDGIGRAHSLCGAWRPGKSQKMRHNIDRTGHADMLPRHL